MSNLRKKLIRLAYQKPELRADLIPLLKSANAKDMAAVTQGVLPFYRGGVTSVGRGPTYFSSFESMAKFYGPVSEYRIKLRNPKFVTTREWGGFDSHVLSFDPSAMENLMYEGHDSAVWATDTPKGRMYTVFALNGRDVIRPI